MRRALASTVLILAVLTGVPAAAAVFRATSVEESTRTSDAVVRGVVQGQTSRYSADRSKIVTDVTVAVTSAWKGRAGKVVKVTIPGGEVGDVGLWVDGAPRFTVGEEVVLFLAARRTGFLVNGLALGKWSISGAEAVPSVSTDDLRPAALAAGEAVVARMPVADLERRVRGAK